MGKSGTIKPSNPALELCFKNSSIPYAKKGLKYPINIAGDSVLEFLINLKRSIHPLRVIPF